MNVLFCKFLLEFPHVIGSSFKYFPRIIKSSRIGKKVVKSHKKVMKFGSTRRVNPVMSCQTWRINCLVFEIIIILSFIRYQNKDIILVDLVISPGVLRGRPPRQQELSDPGGVSVRIYFKLVAIETPKSHVFPVTWLYLEIWG